ncbi:MAG: glycosyltransferase family 2 protein [bacterium]
MSHAPEENIKPLVSIIIVTWNCRDHVLQCLKTIYASRKARFEVIVRDNGSEDGTWQAIQEKYPMVKLIGDSRNIGFAAANNEAIAQAGGSYLLLLNPDTEISSTTISELVASAKMNNHRAMLVPTLLNGDGTIQPSWHSFPTLSGIVRKSVEEAKKILRKPVKGEARSVDWAIGACWFIPAAVYQKVGGLDANLFMYGEDLDYCWRMHRAGADVIWAPAIQVIHHGNVSGAQKWGERRLIKTHQVVIYFWMKHFGPHYVFIMAPIRMMYYLLQAARDFAKSIFKAADSQGPSYQNHCLHAIALVQACFDRSAWPFYRAAWKRQARRSG